MDDLVATFRDHSPRVMAVAFRILRDRAEAEDVVQDTFAEAWRVSSRYDDARGTVAAWLCCMARSRAIDRLRVRESAARAFDRLREAPPPLAPEPLSGERERRRLHAALSRLPATQREAVELAYFSGLSHQHIATATGSPLGTVKTRLRLALQRLSALLEDDSHVPAGRRGFGY